MNFISKIVIGQTDIEAGIDVAVFYFLISE